MPATVQWCPWKPFSWYGDGPYHWVCHECQRAGNYDSKSQAQKQADDHNGAKHSCSCRWESIFEGEAVGTSYRIVESDKRCVTHGKPRHVAKSG